MALADIPRRRNRFDRRFDRIRALEEAGRLKHPTGSRLVRKFMSNRLAVVGLVVFSIILLAAIFAPLLTPWDPTKINLRAMLQPPSWEHWFGTDKTGRDVFARVLYGGRISILVGLGSAVVSAIIGVIVGCYAGYVGGWFDAVCMRISEIIMAFPELILVLMLVSILGQSLSNIMIIFILGGWCGIYRLARASMLSLREEEYVQALRSFGLSVPLICFKHILPNALGPIMVNITLSTAAFILAEAGLSFLGLGVPMNIATWGNILNVAQDLGVLQNNWWIWLPVGTTISLFVLSVNFIGDGLRDATDPTQQGLTQMTTTTQLPVNDVALSVRDLKTFFYTNKRCNKAVNGVSFEIKKGKTLCIVGESGCGKSVTASAIMQLLPTLSRIEDGEIVYHSERGDIRLDTLERNGKAMRSIRGSEIAMIFQDPMTALNPVFTIGFQIVENLRYHTAMRGRQLLDKAIDLLRSMGIPAPERRVEQFPHQFSGGMRQRAMIAMAMACNPKILIADEPTTALDVTIQAQIFELMATLKREHGTAIMLITHDMGVVAELADDVAVMYMGNIVEAGTVDEVLRRPSHPYTRALLDSVPVLGRGKNQDIRAIPGSTPDPFNRPKGCQFADRCAYKLDACETALPAETQLSPTHRVMCVRHEEFANGVRN